jgi:hypothetical protein
MMVKEQRTRGKSEEGCSYGFSLPQRSDNSLSMTEGAVGQVIVNETLMQKGFSCVRAFVKVM